MVKYHEIVTIIKGYVSNANVCHSSKNIHGRHNLVCVWERESVRTSISMCVSELACLCSYKSQGSMLVSSYRIAIHFIYLFFPPYPFELRVFHWNYRFPLSHPKSWNCRHALPCLLLWVLDIQTQVLCLCNKYITYWAPGENLCSKAFF